MGRSELEIGTEVTECDEGEPNVGSVKEANINEDGWVTTGLRCDSAGGLVRDAVTGKKHLTAQQEVMMSVSRQRETFFFPSFLYFFSPSYSFCY